MENKLKSSIEKQLDELEYATEDLLIAQKTLNRIGHHSKSLDNLIISIDRKIEKLRDRVSAKNAKEAEVQRKQDILNAESDVLDLVDQSKARGFNFFVVPEFSDIEKAAKKLGFNIDHHSNLMVKVHW